MRKAYIFDIDSTLSNCAHREHYLRDGNRDWASFFAGMADDEPIDEVVEVLRSLHEASFSILLVTGREEKYREATEEWLKLHDIPYDRLEMRPLYSRADDTVIKKGATKQLAKEYHILGAFEDRIGT